MAKPREPRTIGYLRQKLGMTQTQLAALVSVNQVDISVQENSAVPELRYEALERIAKVLDVDDPSDLLLTFGEYIKKHS